VSVIAFLPGDVLHLVGAAKAKGLARLVGELRAAVAVVPIQLAVRSGGD
jgi:hypothetical protein